MTPAATHGVRQAAPPRIAARGICRSFPGVRALDGVHFEVHAGEVVALVGENGAGKSTLMKLLAGLLQPDGGELLLDGRATVLGSPSEALRRGIALIHQELSLCDNLTVTGALFLGQELRCGPFLREAAMLAAARECLQRLGLELDPRTALASLSLAQRQLVEIARALRADARVLIMDEPTSSLGQAETERLFAVVRQLRADGVGVVYITHRLAEVATLADRVVGLRDGRNSGALARQQISHEAMVELMVGRTLQHRRRRPHPPDEPLLEVRGLATTAFPEARNDLVLRAGEMVGIAGLLGSGRSELLRALAGVDARSAGEVRVAGRTLPPGSIAAAIDSGLVMLPEDRQRQGLVLGMDVQQNLSLPTLRRRGRWLDRGYERTLARRSIDELQIAGGGATTPVEGLSGGNQQKVVLGKWLAAAPRVLLLDEPTRGVDIGARAELYRRLDTLVQQGCALLFVSSELEEVLQLADRVLVMRDGAIVGQLAGDGCSEQAILRLATGLLREEEVSA